jgi:cellulose synthase/poly-beta-1,6-N-acetylglucosamine synthase-like glycosyltransferase
MFEIVFLVVVCLYFLQSVIFIIGTRKKFKRIDKSRLPSATIIVAARNEEENILRCLQSLNNLEYPEGKLEIIMVDDKSTDNTGRIIDEFIKDKPKFKKIITEKEKGRLKGKTNAIANAIDIATGEIILTTDADCAVSTKWATTIASYYEDNVAIVNGFTTQEINNNFNGMQNLDFIYLLTVAAGTINFDNPLSCIGNNMSFRKTAYYEVGGYENLPFSVTEDFNLLFAIYKLKKYKIIYPLDVNALVISKPCKSFTEIYRQKKRWGVGGLKSPLRGYIVMTIGFLTNLGILISPFYFSVSVLYLIAFKLMVDFFFLYYILKKLNYQQAIKYFIAFEIYFTLYVIILPFIILPSQKVNWKGREY